ncbi:MAG: cation transporter [Calditerrivibrio sp.]|nr:cation transporter [Calditerrivibrio sp.]MCA1980611.1 cation transporter [Calditerrivibrio sp.]
MKKTIYHVKEMDCPSEEHMIRMKLSHLSTISDINFDIPQRSVTIVHNEKELEILRLIKELGFTVSVVESYNINDTNGINDKNKLKENILLWKVLFINLFFFILEVLYGFVGNSMGLIADGLDMLADSIVYGLAIYASKGTLKRKKNVTALAGFFQLLLALSGFIEVLRRFTGSEIFPDYSIMITISVLALFGNLLSLYILQRSKSNEVHMKASMIFTSNDIIVNLGVILAGVFVYATNSRYPDLIIGFIVFLLVINGGIKIVKLSR